MNRPLVLAALLVTLTACHAEAPRTDAPAEVTGVTAAVDSSATSDDGVAADSIDDTTLTEDEAGYLAALTGGSCGDGQCQPPEDCQTCAADCGGCCGNGKCEPPEDCTSCSSDCGSCCGNGKCQPPEDCNSCSQDCGPCQ